MHLEREALGFVAELRLLLCEVLGGVGLVGGGTFETFMSGAGDLAAAGGAAGGERGLVIDQGVGEGIVGEAGGGAAALLALGGAADHFTGGAALASFAGAALDFHILGHLVAG